FLELRLRRRPSFSLFPYTTLFRSARDSSAAHDRISELDRDPRRRSAPAGEIQGSVRSVPLASTALGVEIDPRCTSDARISPAGRSEEHTSELQSHLNLVCRLLLEK